jgi:hypothetical protein
MDGKLNESIELMNELSLSRPLNFHLKRIDRRTKEGRKNGKEDM